MFTGIITAVGQLQAVEDCGGDSRITVQAPGWNLDTFDLGESIAVNGVCLTVIRRGGDTFQADVSVETLQCTSLRDLRAGARVNLERALLAGQPLGGHLVSGHVDGLGEVAGIRPDARSTRFDIRAPADLARFVAAKGSVTIDGVSLTVNSVSGREFSVNIVPHTMQHTIIGSYEVGTQVNLEVDQVARYLERLLEARQ